MGSLLKRYKARPFQSFARPEGGAQRPRCQKSRLIYQLIEMKLGMSNYDHKSIPYAKFESGSYSSFGDMTSQNFNQKKGTSHQFGYLRPENGFNLKKKSFYVQNRSSRPKIDPPCQLQQFASRGKFLNFLNFWDASMIKEQQ